MAFRSVLIIDNNHETRVTLRRIFQDSGHFVISAETGAEAILMLESLSVPALVLVSTDLLMNGESFLVSFRAFDRYAKIPAIQIKHSKDEPDLDGVCGTVIKPFSESDVLATLKHCE